jgi:hypothetical protein
MTQGERETAVDRDRLLHRHRLRIRTVTVSFRAAVASARDDFVGPASERDALVEVWRAWSIDQLERYRADLHELGERRPELADAVRELLADLEDAVRAVRSD